MSSVMHGRQIRKAHFPDGAADIATRFGISVKALRLYERQGLIAPVRDANGWRTYGQEDCRRLHAVLAMRQLGFPLARIEEILRGADADLEAVLALQEQVLIEQRARANEALVLVREARRRLAAEEASDLAELARLASQSPISIRWSRDLHALAESVFTGAQRKRLSRLTADLDVDWAPFYLRLRQLADIGDPASPEARDLGCEARHLIDSMTGGSEAMRRALVHFWRSGFSDPATAAELPMNAAQWAFLGRVIGKPAATAQAQE